MFSLIFRLATRHVPTNYFIKAESHMTENTEYKHCYDRGDYSKSFMRTKFDV